jgi:C4-type Zn-finger protein
MRKYLTRTCPKCAGSFGVIVTRVPYRSTIHAVSGWCERCDYEIAWALIMRTRLRALAKPLDPRHKNHDA